MSSGDVGRAGADCGFGPVSPTDPAKLARRAACCFQWMVLALLLAVLSACAPWQPAPVEERAPATRSQQPAVRQPPPPLHEVQRGDTLYSIAFRYGLDWRSVAEWNRIQAPYTIRPGQELRLSAPPALAQQSPPRQTADRPAAQPPVARPSSPPAETPHAGEQRPSGSPAERPRAADPSPTRAPRPSAQAAPPADGAAASATRSVAGVAWQWPTAGRISRPFDPAATRRGLGISGQAGQSVVAAADGEVVYSGTALIGYGELIIIKHSETMLSAYGHNRRRLVEEGDRVRRGQQIAEMGMNERDEEILHFEIRRNGQPEDPQRFLPPRN